MSSSEYEQSEGAPIESDMYVVEKILKKVLCFLFRELLSSMESAK
jgi:hypothetical protein